MTWLAAPIGFVVVDSHMMTVAVAALRPQSWNTLRARIGSEVALFDCGGDVPADPDAFCLPEPFWVDASRSGTERLV